MKTKKACWIVCAGLLLYACHESPHTQTIVWEGFDEEMRANGEGLAVDSFFAIPLQTDRQCLVESVKKIVPAGSLLVLSPRKTYWHSTGKGSSCAALATKATEKENITECPPHTGTNKHRP